MAIDYAATAARAFAEIDATPDRFGEFAGALAIHAANFRDVAHGTMVDHGTVDHFFRQGERFFRIYGLLVEVIKYPIYFKICPRGFANEVIYIACFSANEKVTIELEYADYSDKNPCGFAEWSSDRAAMIPGVAISFRNRNY